MSDPNEPLLIISCFLSIIGASCLLWDILSSREKRNRPGSKLLAWLSFTDLCSSLTYSISAMSQTNQNGDLCKVQSVLGMFFPIASFFWTDFIAYYVYNIVVLRRARDEQENVKKLFIAFHCICWPIAAILCILVVATDHAGYENFLNTGGWCWIKLRSGQISEDDDGDKRHDQMVELFIWEVIGGKGIEWISCFIVVPILYFLSFKSLRQLQKSQEMKEEMMRATEVAAVSMKSRAMSSNSAKYITPTSSPSNWSPVKNYTLTSDSNLSSALTSPRRTKSSSHSFVSSEAATIAALTEPMITSDAESGLLVVRQSLDKPAIDNSLSNTGMSTAELSVLCPQEPTPTSKKMIDFSLFNTRLAVFPILFVLIRLWGSLRVLIMFSYAMSGSYIPTLNWLGSMQAFFDPAQGFFNALVYFTFLRQDKKAGASTPREFQTQEQKTKYDLERSTRGINSPGRSNRTVLKIDVSEEVKSQSQSAVVTDEHDGWSGNEEEAFGGQISDMFTPLAGNSTTSFGKGSPRLRAKRRRKGASGASSDGHLSNLSTPTSINDRSRKSSSKASSDGSISSSSENES